MSASVILAAEEQTRDLPMPPVLFGLITMALFVAMLMSVLMFGKGRPHS